MLPQKQMTKAEARKAIDDIRSEAESFPEMSLEEINDEIRAARAERRKRKTKK